MKKDHVSLQRQPFLAPIWLAALAVLGALAAAVVASFVVWLWITADSTTVVVIRHAEKEVGSLADPPLSAAGQARAALLARMIGDASAADRINAIYVSAALRNRMTAAPLAARLGLTPTVAAGNPRTLARQVLREHAGGRILIVWHADTMPTLVMALSGIDQLAPIGDADFGTMFIVTVPRIGRANLLRMEY
jgi:broad specificity phosphatase PhoE